MPVKARNLSISKNLPQTFSEMLVEAYKHILAEEIIETRRNLRKGNKHINESRRNQRGRLRESKRKGEEGSQIPHFQRNWFEIFTPLNTTHIEMLMKIEGRYAEKTNLDQTTI